MGQTFSLYFNKVNAPFDKPITLLESRSRVKKATGLERELNPKIMALRMQKPTNKDLAVVLETNKNFSLFHMTLIYVIMAWAILINLRLIN